MFSKWRHEYQFSKTEFATLLNTVELPMVEPRSY